MRLHRVRDFLVHEPQNFHHIGNNLTVIELFHLEGKRRRHMHHQDRAFAKMV